ncbi:MAG: hypothetical protein RLZZ417_2849 [Bacteroidota bacterium]|jgi:hypothetical protein
MKNIPFRFLFTIILSSLFIQSCHNKEAIIQNLSHRWIIEKGFRNEKETDSLSGLYFQFGKTGEVTTNLNGQDERLTYKLKGEDIIEMTGSTEIFLNIIELSETKLILQTDLQGFKFKFEMLKDKK